ncbi:MAG: SoxR reducing system RseC family protein [Candidatus Marinimicrobia bacterium]|nr:SoxR reducing system RseC family protein [Candidatus Neomarinimicrobiota bacterium]
MPTKGIISDKRNNKAYIRIQEDNTACAGCAAHALCGKKDCDDAQIILNDRPDFHVGDAIEIEEKQNILIKTSLLAYGIPLVFFAVGVLGGQYIPVTNFPIELLQFACGCLGLLAGGFLGRYLAQRISRRIDKYFTIKVK